MTDPTPSVEQVWQILATILDPEFAINIVDMGLIYSVECNAGHVTVTMTLTTPTCPSGSWIREGAQTAVSGLPGVTQTDVNLVFEPRWSTEMLSAAARQQLGWSPAADDAGAETIR